MALREAEALVDERRFTAPPTEPDGASAPSLRSAPVPALVPWRPRLFVAGLDAAQGSILAALETERLRGGGFVLAPVFFAAGAYAYAAADAEPSLAGLSLALLVAVALVRFVRDRVGVRALALVPALILAGMLAGKLETLRHATPMLGSAVATHIAGRIVAVERQASGRVRLTVDVLSTREPALRFAPARIRVTAAGMHGPVRPGQGVEGRVRLMPPSGPVRPGGYDFAWRAWFDGIGANGFFLGKPALADPPAQPLPARLAGAMEALRFAMAERIRARIGGAEGEIAAALIVGETAGVPKPLVEAMQVSGLFHVLSISGLHMALVAGLVMGGLRLGFAAFPHFVERHAVKKFAAAAALAASTFYLFLSGAGVATQRSYLMIAVMLAAVMADRAALTMRNLAIAAFVIVAIAPHEVAGPSFQMSFAATAALIAGWGAFSRWRLRHAHAAPHRSPVSTALRWAGAAVAGVAVTSLLAGAATGLFAAWHFHRVAPMGLVANVAAMPVISGVIMPAGVAAALAMPFGLDGPFLDAMGWGVSVMDAIAVRAAAVSPLDAVGLVPGFAVAAFTAGLAIAAAATTRLAFLSAPIFAVATLAAFAGAPPHVFVSEDARLVGVVEGGRIAVNRDRPNAFVLDQWRAAAGGADIVGPGAGGFRCADETCVLARDGRTLVVHTPDAAAAQPHCAGAALIVVADATAKGVCRRGEATVLTARELARRGAAAVRFAGEGGRIRAAVEFSVPEPFRPWHAHRAFSRAARGLAERKAAAKAAGPAPAN